ncbi:MAG TPA: glycosyltransferase, partial [Gammaproteobacteria bacterium]
MNSTDLTILLPVYNDWAALNELLGLIDRALLDARLRAGILIVDDGSHSESDWMPRLAEDSAIAEVVVLTLDHNHGHQFAIAVGLAHLGRREHSGAVVVMDADGEDDPAYIPALLQESASPQARVVFAARRRRLEGRAFRTGYLLYRLAFRALAGRSISFGNYCAIPGSLLGRVNQLPGTAQHFAAALMRSRIPHTTVPADRKPRLAGEPRMNLISLIRHGMGAIYQYADLMAVRLMMLSLFLLLASVLGGMIVVAEKIFTDMAIPGWASTMVLGLTLVFLQSLMLSIFLVFASFQQQTLQNLAVADNYLRHIIDTRRL